MTDSTRFLNSAQAAARLGVKPATLYAYVSRGLLPRHRSADGRTSLFDPADLSRLERRSGAGRGAPSEVVVASELTLVDTAAGRLWYRGLDPVEACRSRRFEEIAGWLWTGGFEGPRVWRPDARSLEVAQRAASALGRSASVADRIHVVASAAASSHASDDAADLMSCLVDGLPGPSANATHFAARLAAKLGASRGPTQKLVDAALSLTCDHALTYSTLLARISAAGGAGVAASVAAAFSAGVVATRASRFESIERALATTARDGSLRGADAMDRDAIVSACSGPYRGGDPRARVLLEMLDEHDADASGAARLLAEELRRRGGGPPTVTFAQAAVSWACAMRPGSGEVIALVSRAAGWIAHALEEQRRPTPYRPRLAYTGPPPRATPRRPLDAVVDYLSRE